MIIKVKTVMTQMKFHIESRWQWFGKFKAKFLGWWLLLKLCFLSAQQVKYFFKLVKALAGITAYCLPSVLYGIVLVGSQTGVVDINFAFHLCYKCCMWVEFQSISTWLRKFSLGDLVSSPVKIDSHLGGMS